MTNTPGENGPVKAKAPAFSRRSFVRYGAAGLGVAVLGGGIAVMANRPPMSPRQQGLPDLPDWTAADVPSLRGRSAVVTGGNGYPVGDRSGLGFHEALELARAGADVTIASRKQERGEEAVRRIKASVPGASIRFETLDLSDLDSVARFAERMRGSGGSLDILVNNAGVMGRKSREVSANGFERVFATNTLGHFALTARLLPLLRRSSSPRVVWVSSSRSFMGAINFADLQLVHDYDYGAAYDNSKLANLMLAFEMQRRSLAEGWGVSAIAAHPGIARTNLVPDGPGPDSWRGAITGSCPSSFRRPLKALCRPCTRRRLPRRRLAVTTARTGFWGWAVCPAGPEFRKRPTTSKSRRGCGPHLSNLAT